MEEAPIARGLRVRGSGVYLPWQPAREQVFMLIVWDPRATTAGLTNVFFMPLPPFY